jgi:hypothetical protein
MATTTAINFGSLVGAQLDALIEAEVQGAEKTSEYIENVGFETAENGELRLRMVTFRMSRRDVDGEVREHKISVPVLTLVPIPLLTIEEATLEFDLRVEKIETTQPKKSQSVGGSRAASVATGPQGGGSSSGFFTPQIGVGSGAGSVATGPQPGGSNSGLSTPQTGLGSGARPPASKARLLTRLARTTHQDSKTTSDLKMKVKIAQSAFPLGIERLINSADLSVDDVAE